MSQVDRKVGQADARGLCTHHTAPSASTHWHARPLPRLLAPGVLAASWPSAPFSPGWSGEGGRRWGQAGAGARARAVQSGKAGLGQRVWGGGRLPGVAHARKALPSEPGPRPALSEGSLVGSGPFQLLPGPLARVQPGTPSAGACRRGLAVAAGTGRVQVTWGWASHATPSQGTWVSKVPCMAWPRQAKWSSARRCAAFPRCRVSCSEDARPRGLSTF